MRTHLHSIAKRPIAKRPIAKRLLTASLCTLLLAGCASTPRPEEVCSANWIKPRTDAALGEFRTSTSDIWEQLENTGKKAAENGKLSLLERASVLFSLTRLVNSFQSSQALDDLQTLSKTCNDPQLVRTALRDTLTEYNVPQQYIDLLNELDTFTTLLQQSESGINKP